MVHNFHMGSPTGVVFIYACGTKAVTLFIIYYEFTLLQVTCNRERLYRAILILEQCILTPVLDEMPV